MRASFFEQGLDSIPASTRSRRWYGTTWLQTGAMLCLLTACGGQTTGPDSSSHWLSTCNSDSDCGGELQCLCGVCSVNCDADSTCQNGTARSATQSHCARAECAPAPLCLRSCNEQADCSGSQVCSDGACVGSSGSDDIPEPDDAPGPDDHDGSPVDAGSPTSVDAGNDSPDDAGNDSPDDAGNDSPDEVQECSCSREMSLECACELRLECTSFEDMLRDLPACTSLNRALKSCGPLLTIGLDTSEDAIPVLSGERWFFDATTRELVGYSSFTDILTPEDSCVGGFTAGTTMIDSCDADCLLCTGSDRSCAIDQSGIALPPQAIEQDPLSPTFDVFVIELGRLCPGEEPAENAEVSDAEVVVEADLEEHGASGTVTLRGTGHPCLDDVTFPTSATSPTIAFESTLPEWEAELGCLPIVSFDFDPELNASFGGNAVGILDIHCEGENPFTVGGFHFYPRQQLQ